MGSKVRREVAVALNNLIHLDPESYAAAIKKYDFYIISVLPKGR
jgi:hypothetical protein